MRVSLTLLASLAAVLAPGMATAQDENCEVPYVIQPGDTLAGIAETAYGARNYQLIYARNPKLSAFIGDLPAGESIVIPCLPGVGGLIPDEEALTAAMAAGGVAPEASDSEETAEAEPEPAEETAAEAAEATLQEEAAEETLAESEAEAPTPEAEASADAGAETEAAPEPAAEAVETALAADEPAAEEPDAAPAADGPPLRFLTASDQRPFADQSLRKGGMITELVAIAMERMTAAPPYKVVFVNDKESHLQDLLIDGSFDIGFPWLRPRCDELERLREVDAKGAWMCENFAFSEPFYEFVNGFFVRSGVYSAARIDWDDFIETRICRPAGEPLTDLFVKGLVDGETEFVRPETAKECLQLLAAGEVDAVSIEVFEAEEMIGALDLKDQIEEMPHLSLLWTVHAIAPKAKPAAADRIASLDKELISLKISGEWFRIVARHLAQN